VGVVGAGVMGMCLTSGREVLEMTRDCFLQQALVLHRRAGSLVLTDSTHYHCWTVPVGTAPGAKEGGMVEASGDRLTVCCCGGVALSSLPASTSWHSISPHTHSQPSPLTLSHVTPTCYQPSPPGPAAAVTQCSVCDAMAPRLAALTCAAELACSVLTTAFTVNCSQ